MRNNCVNRGMFHFLDARSWAPMPVLYENRSGYITGNSDVNIRADLVGKFLALKNHRGEC